MYTILKSVTTLYIHVHVLVHYNTCNMYNCTCYMYCSVLHVYRVSDIAIEGIVRKVVGISTVYRQGSRVTVPHKPPVSSLDPLSDYLNKETEK